MVEKTTGDGEAEFVVSDALKRQVREALFSNSSSRTIIDIPNTDTSPQAQASAAKELLASTNDKQNNQQEPDGKLEARKQFEIEKIKAIRATTTDPEVLKELDNLIDKIESAKSIDGLIRVLASVSATVSAALGKADDKSQARDPLHKELYATDAVYGKRVDEITENSNVLQDESKQRRETSDEIAKKHGIETKHDKDMADLLKEYDGLSELDKKSQKARDLELKILLKEREQNEARIKQLENKGLSSEAEILKKNTPPIEEAIKKATQNYLEQQEEYYKAMQRKLERDGVPAEKIKKYVENLRNMQEQTLERALQDKDKAVSSLQMRTEEIEGQLKDFLAAEKSQPLYTPEPKTNEEKAAEKVRREVLSEKMVVAEASLAQELKVPNANQTAARTEPSTKQLF